MPSPSPGGGRNTAAEAAPAPRHNADLRPFFFGGVASCVAEATTFPIDTAKTRLQLQGQTKDVRHSSTPYRGMVHCWKRIAAEEGVRMLYSGLSPALLRQAVYGTIKYGLYYTIKDILGGEESAVKNVSCAVVAGSVSAAVANPTDVLKVRMQSRSAPVVILSDVPKQHVGMMACFKDMYVREGVAGLWRGVFPTAQRAALVAGVQLPVYDQTKLFILRHGLLPGDSALNHLLSSFCAGLCACLASSPIDVIRTRLMDQRKLRSKMPKLGTDRIYRSSMECAVATVRNEGVQALYKGFVPAFTRMGPWNIIFFLVYEQLKRATSVQ